MITFTGKGIDVFRLVTMKHAVQIEALGMRVTRGRKWTTVAKREFGLKRNATVAQIVQAIDDRLATLVPEAHAEGGITK